MSSIGSSACSSQSEEDARDIGICGRDEPAVPGGGGASNGHPTGPRGRGAYDIPLVLGRGTYDVPAQLVCDRASSVKPKLNVKGSRSGLSNRSCGTSNLGSPCLHPPDPPSLSPPCPGSAGPRPPGCGGTRAHPPWAPPPGNLRVPLFTSRAPRSGIGSRGRQRDGCTVNVC
ncbi:hypothetical protein M9H77_21519 [Catharanthus roseus]|uniref:Uncharacterized protein n=1 Tax=Catharanthus roseus TaxID=4058 RepID=A0ACC0ANK4_CATRO|nr:hypothetical protein M9H77_21519 [Catharanthus roseus]